MNKKAGIVFIALGIFCIVAVSVFISLKKDSNLYTNPYTGVSYASWWDYQDSKGEWCKNKFLEKYPEFVNDIVGGYAQFSTTTDRAWHLAPDTYPVQNDCHVRVYKNDKGVVKFESYFNL